MANFLSEDNIEQADIQYYELNLGYEHINCYADDKLFGRKSRKEVVSTVRLRKALVKLNPNIPPAQIDYAVEQLTQAPASGNYIAANKHFYYLIRNGISVKYNNNEGKTEHRMEIFLAG